MLQGCLFDKLPRKPKIDSIAAADKNDCSTTLVIHTLTKRKNIMNNTANTVSSVTTRDGVEIYYKDWGPKTGQPVVLSHGWPLNAESWESAAFHLANNGFRVI